jgi:cell division protein FtsI/penicillin-binding protein 2
MKRILCDVPIRGTAANATNNPLNQVRSSIWNIFGKTGTAHISQGKAGYASDKYTSSFMSAAPAENPRIVVVMIVHEPDAEYGAAHGLSHYGGAVAAPGAARVIERTLSYLQVPQSPDLPIPPPNIANVLYEFNPKLYTERMASARE